MPAPTRATPRPWTASQDGHYGFVYLKDASGRRIATMYGAEDTKLERATDIVTAVNSFDALVEALTDLEAAAGYARRFMTGHERGSRDLEPVELDAALDRARRALAAARPTPTESDNAG